MDRRGFLGSLLAVTGAVASGVKLPSSKAVATATRQAIETQNTLIRLLKECAVVAVSTNCAIDGPLTYDVEYIHTPGHTRKRTGDEELVCAYTDKMRPVSVQFSRRAGELTRLTVTWA